METAIQILDVLGGNVLNVEWLYGTIEAIQPADQYTFDMGLVSFVRPYGVIALATAARRLSEQSQRPVLLRNIPGNVHSYLHRMNLFEVGSDWLRPAEVLGEEWSRNPQTRNLLELTPITCADDVAIIVARANSIFERWLTIPDLRSLLTVLSELCANVYQHSRDQHGSVMIQKYDAVTHGRVDVQLAVGDLGCGIRGSLMGRFGAIGQEPLDYLYEAMRGRSARHSGRGGLGLRQVEQIAKSQSGFLWLRSETAAILSQGTVATTGHPNLVSVPGTQVAVEFHFPSRA